MFTISKKFEFSASHQLVGLPDDHPCSRLHGHNYTIEVELQSDGVDETGFVVDYRELDVVKRWIDDILDHRSAVRGPGVRDPEDLRGVPTVSDLIVSEIFSSLQGEGPSSGRPATFVRLGLCNLDCSWCDTPYTWDWSGKNGPPQDKSALRHIPIADVAREIRDLDTRLVVITGGEPMIQAKGIEPLLRMIGATEIETNGSIAPPGPWVCRFNVSPKLPSSGVDEKFARLAMDNFRHVPRSVFKFVVADRVDLDAASELCSSFGIAPERVWIMPEARTRAELLDDRWADVVEEVLARRYNFSSRLHVMLWNDERAR
jgi:7-carboxy-7-deazaguanine synthase